MSEEIINEDGEVITTALALADSGTLSTVVRAEIDSQIATAHAYPRNPQRAMQSLLTLTTMDEETAQEAIYSLPRGGKPVEGPSIRLAEAAAQCWGNNRSGATVLTIDRVEKVVVAEGFYHDLESNMASRSTVRRRIVDRNGRIYNDDMIIVTGNAACSIAKRNAILAGIPRAIWGRAYRESRRIIAGDATTLVVTRDKAIAAMSHFGLKPADVFAIIGVESVEAITLEHVVSLRGAFSALKNGETTVEELLRTARGSASQAHEKVADPLANVPKEGAKDQTPADKDGQPAGDQAAPAESKAEPGRNEAEPATIGAQAAAKEPAGESTTKEPAKPTSNAPKALTDAEKQTWWDKGHKRGVAGSARSLPKDLQTIEMREAANAFFEGYDTAKAEAENKAKGIEA